MRSWWIRRALALVWLGGFVAWACPIAAETALVALVLDDDARTTRAKALEALRDRGVRPAYVLDGLVLVEAPRSEERALGRLPGVREASAAAFARGRSRGRSEPFRIALEAWNAGIARPEGRRGALARPRGALPTLGGEHAWLPPPHVALAPSPSAVAASVSEGATAANTSEYLAGAVSMNLFLVESDGRVDPSTENWSADRESLVVNGVLTGLEWVRAREAQAGLTFVVHVVPGRTDARARTSYEPVRRAADPHGRTGEDLWVGEILSKMGQTTGDRFARSRALAHATRAADRSDWAVNVFIADSLADADGAFADGLFAYAWISGPHLVMTYDNQAWGIARMDMVLRHEVLHAFWAFDEYTASRCACSEHRGYLDGFNANCAACNLAAEPCVMIANGDALCAHSRRQIGWADLDGDGIVDVVGEDPDTFLDDAPARICGALALSGTAAVVAPTNRNPSTLTPPVSISIASIAGVEVGSASTGGWTAATATDGAWGGAVESFRVELLLSAGLHDVRVRARDDLGNVDGTPAGALVDVRPAAAALGSPVLGRRAGVAGVALSWGAAPGAVAYRVRRAAAPRGPWELLVETDQPTWADDPEGPAYYTVAPVDACGVEPSAAAR